MTRRTTVYLHPYRTVLLRWAIEADGPVCIGSTEMGAVFPATDQPSTLADVLQELRDDGDVIDVVVHSSQTRFHRYPVEDDEPAEIRRTFELQTCFPDLQAGADLVLDVHLPGPVLSTSWHGVFVVPSSIVRFSADIAPGRQLTVCTLSDAAAFQRYVREDESPAPSALIGKRGQTWWTIVVDDRGTLRHIGRTTSDHRMDPSVEIRDMLLDLHATMDIRVENLVLFGDSLTKDVLDDTRSATTSLVQSVTRFVPFRLVRADIDDETARSLTKRAHILGPCLGVVLSTTELVSRETA